MRACHSIGMVVLAVLMALAGCNKPVTPTGPVTYTATAYLQVLPIIEGSLVEDTISSLAMPERVALEIELAGVDGMFTDALEVPSVRQTPWYASLTPDDRLAALREITTIAPASEPDQITVSVTLDNAHEAAAIATALGETIERRSAAGVNDLYQDRFSDLRRAMGELRDMILQREVAMESLSHRADPEGIADLQDQLATLGEQKDGVIDALRAVQETIDSLQMGDLDSLVEVPIVAETLAGLEDYTQMQEALAVLRAGLEMQLSQGEDSPAVRATRNQIAILRDQLTGLQELVVADMLRQAVREQGTLTGRLNGIDNVIARLGEELAEALGAAEAFADLQAEAEAITQRLTGMQEVLASLQNQQEDDRRLLLLGPAELPTMPN